MLMGFLSLLMMSGAIQSAGCEAPGNASDLWSDSGTRFVVVGEVHGTEEGPTAFGEIVCEASATRAVVVGLEYEDTAQPAFDAWMRSAGSDADRDALLASSAFTRRFEDGRSSIAMLKLFERLRELKANGARVSVVAFRPSTYAPTGFDQNYAELAMAQRLSALAQTDPDALAVILVGRFHASQTGVGTIRPAVSHLPAAAVVSIAVMPQGGQMWSCAGDGPVPDCGPHQYGGEDDGIRGVVLDRASGAAFGGALMLGPTTASLPAKGDSRRED